MQHTTDCQLGRYIFPDPPGTNGTSVVQTYKVLYTTQDQVAPPNSLLVVPLTIF